MEKDSDQNEEEIKKVNGEFYRAFESLSIERIAKLWKHNENVMCIHPGWDLFMGWLAISRIFDNKMAVVMCRKHRNIGG